MCCIIYSYDDTSKRWFCRNLLGVTSVWEVDAVTAYPTLVTQHSLVTTRLFGLSYRTQMMFGVYNQDRLIYTTDLFINKHNI